MGFSLINHPFTGYPHDNGNSQLCLVFCRDFNRKAVLMTVQPRESQAWWPSNSWWLNWPVETCWNLESIWNNWLEFHREQLDDTGTNWLSKLTEGCMCVYIILYLYIYIHISQDTCPVGSLSTGLSTLTLDVTHYLRGDLDASMKQELSIHHNQDHNANPLCLASSNQTEPEEEPVPIFFLTLEWPTCCFSTLSMTHGIFCSKIQQAAVKLRLSIPFLDLLGSA